MKIALVSASLSRQAGGIFEIELALAKQLQVLGADCHAYGLEDDRWPEDSARWAPVTAKTFVPKGGAFFGYAPDLLQTLVASKFDVAHLQTLWMYPSVAIHQWSKATKKPYVVTPNGMLEPWALRNSGWKKKLAGLLYENRMLHGAACLQANTEKEMDDIRAYGLRNPVAVIPNGVELPVGEPTVPPPWEGRLGTGRKVMLYLGRLHPKKNLKELIKTWASVQKDPGAEEWVLAIAGWDQGGYEDELKTLATELNVGWEDLRGSPFTTLRSQHPVILFTGPLFNEEKSAAYFHSDAFILPSLSEGLPMVVLEAWAWKLPVLMTKECNLPEGFSTGSAISIETGAASIAEGLSCLFEMNGNEQKAMAAAGRSLVEERFSWQSIAQDMRRLYEWVTNGGAHPEFIRLQ